MSVIAPFLTVLVLMASLCPSAQAAVCGEEGASRPLYVPVANQLGHSDRLLYAGSYALVVGSSTYKVDPPWGPLDAVDYETRVVSKVLASQGFSVRRICNPDAHGAGSLEDVKKFLDQHHGRQDRVVIYLSGHGWASKDKRVGYYAAADSGPPYTKDGADRAIDSGAINALAKGYRGLHLLVIVDACYSATLFTQKSADDPQGISLVDYSDVSNPARQFITAGGPGEETPSPSTFTPAVLLGISGYADTNHDGFVRVSELALWVHDKVINSKGLKTATRSGFVPVSDDDFGLNGGDMVFKYDANSRAQVLAALTKGSDALQGMSAIRDVNAPVSASPLSNSTKYRVTYFEKEGDGDNVIKALASGKIPALRRGTILPKAGATNGIACHPQADGAEVRKVAKSLIEGGVHIRVIDQVTKNVELNRFAIQALEFKRMENSRFRDLTVADLEEITGCPKDFKKLAARN